MLICWKSFQAWKTTGRWWAAYEASVKIFPLIQTDRLNVLKGPGLSENCFVSQEQYWYLLFVVEVSSSLRKSWWAINESIKPSESKPTVFGAMKPRRCGGKFQNLWHRSTNSCTSIWMWGYFDLKNPSHFLLFNL